MATNRDIEELTNLFTSGDAWLRKYGVVDNPVAHNNMVLNLRMNFPHSKNVEYFMSKNPEHRRIKVILYFSFWRLLFSNRNRIANDAIDLVKEYLFDYDVSVEIRRWKAK